MSANIYSIESLLVGHYYRSKTIQGEIVSAEKDNRAVWYGKDCESYLVEIGTPSGRKVRTVAVRVRDL